MDSISKNRHFIIGYDGISLPLLLVTGLVAVCGVLFSWTLESRANQFYAFYFALIGGVYGVFLSLDLFLLFVFYEIAVVPKYFLIAIWGGARRQFAAMKLVLYSFGGSALVLLGMLAVFFLAHDASGEALKTFSLLERCKQGQVPAASQQWIFPGDFRRLRHNGRHVAVPHLGTDRPRRCANGSKHAAGRCGDEAGRLRLPTRGRRAVASGRSSLGTVGGGGGNHQHRLRRARCA